MGVAATLPELSEWTLTVLFNLLNGLPTYIFAAVSLIQTFSCARRQLLFELPFTEF